MPITLEWYDVALRLALTVVAGVLFGANRIGRGRPAGLATMVLVCLAASVAMIQTNLLLPSMGKAGDSFITLDLMRLPLGILTGMGFIGAGVILHHGEKIHGITTAATLWLVTVIGLCFGGGQLALRAAASVLGLLALEVLKKLEQRLKQDHNATLILRSTDTGLSTEDVRSTLQAAGFRITSWDVTHHLADGKPGRTLRCTVEWHGARGDLQQPTVVSQLAQRPGVQMLRWRTDA